MPKGSKQRLASSGSTKSDFTLYDFAHATVTPDKLGSLKGGRIKKADMNGWCAEVKHLVDRTGSPSTIRSVGESSWFDRDLSDFDSLEEDEVDDEEEEEGGQEGCGERVKTPKHRRQRHRKLVTSVLQVTNGYEMNGHNHRDRNTGNIYPIDIWFMIGRFIRPEDVSTFASICRSSREVTHCAQFWQRLYHRFYSPLSSVLPDALSPSTIDRIHGLKGRVIRALHILYPPYIERVRSPVQLDSTERIPRLLNLQGLTCSRHWYVNVKQSWSFYWTFYRPTTGSTHQSSTDLLLSAPDVTFNKEIGSVVLQAASPNFVHLPQVTGLVLVNVTTSGGHHGGGVFGCSRGHKLQLVFDAQYVRKSGPVGRGAGVGSTVLSLDPVLQVDVLHWWHPVYPGNKD